MDVAVDVTVDVRMDGRAVGQKNFFLATGAIKWVARSAHIFRWCW